MNRNVTILWKACESRFYRLRNGDPMIDALPINAEVAMAHWDAGVPFGENAANRMERLIEEQENGVNV